MSKDSVERNSGDTINRELLHAAIRLNTLLLAADDPATQEDEGRSFVFVSGLGGSSVRDQDRCLPATPPYGCDGLWASIYSQAQSGRPGALQARKNDGALLIIHGIHASFAAGIAA